jgi:copper chaperone CopZ
MRKIFYLLAILLTCACCSSPDKKVKDVSEPQGISKEHLTQVKFEVKGMTCEGCEQAIIKSIQKMEGIQEATASHIKGQSVVKFDSTLAHPGLISEAITNAGYEVTGFE